MEKNPKLINVGLKSIPEARVHSKNSHAIAFSEIADKFALSKYVFALSTYLYAIHWQVSLTNRVVKVGEFQ